MIQRILQARYKKTAFPTVADVSKVAAYLRKPDVHAVHYKNPDNDPIAEKMQQTIVARSNLTQARKFIQAANANGDASRLGPSVRLIAGEIMGKDLAQAAADTAIEIDSATLSEVVGFVNQIRQQSAQVFADYLGKKDFNMVAHLSFVPKGVAREIDVPCVDDVPIACHLPLALAPTKIMINHHIPEQVQTLLERSNVPFVQKSFAEVSMNQNPGDMDLYEDMVIGHPTFMIGKRDRNFNLVSLHKKATIYRPPISERASVIFYPEPL